MVQSKHPAVPSTEVETLEWTPDRLRNLENLDDVSALFGGQQLTASSELGDGFTLLDDKESLIGKPLVFLMWDIRPGDFGPDSFFVSARVVEFDKQGRIVGKWIVNDGSTGMGKQLKEFTERTGQNGGLTARHGLRVSRYMYTDPATGNQSPAETFYVDTAE